MMRAGAVLLAGIALSGCASSGGRADIATLTSNSDRVIWEAGQKAAKKKDWEVARQHFRRLVDGFPNSELGPEVRLALADTYFQEGGTANYILAASSYREFLTFYPSHPRSDFAQFQVGESYFKQRNGPDRDQTATLQSLEEFQRLLEVYPRSPLVEHARLRIRECRNSLAEAEFKAGYFYQRTREAYRAAISRYEGILKDYPDYASLDEVLYRLAECLIFENRAAEARPHLDRLVKEYPQSRFAQDARRLLGGATSGDAAHSSSAT